MALLVVLLGSALLHCSDDRDRVAQPAAAPAPPPPSPNAGTERAIGDAIRFLSIPSTLNEHAAFYFVYFLHRRFGIEAFAGVRDRYFALVAHAPKPFTGVDLFERVIDPRARLQVDRLETVPHEVDRFTIAALYCDQVPISNGYEALLRRKMSEGGYALTHVVMALEWLRENRCEPQWPELRDQAVEQMAAMVRSDARLDDPEIEAAAFLYYLRRGDLVPPDFPATLLAAQNADGGWAIEWPQAPGAASHWHPTVMALWVLLENQGLGNGAPMIPPRE